jgi:hypothetical protein
MLLSTTRLETQKISHRVILKRAIFWHANGCLKETMNENGHKIESVDSFEADLDSLNGITGECAFAMGVEWSMFRERLKSGKPFTIRCLLANGSRLVKLAERQKRFVEDRPNISAGWTEIFVGDYLA